MLTNTDVIAVDQDPLGKQGEAGGDAGLEPSGLVEDALRDQRPRRRPFQPDSARASITAQWTRLGLPAGNATVRDLWSHADLGNVANGYTATASRATASSC